MGFELPPGDPDTITSALSTLATVGSDLRTKKTSVQSGFASALSTWHGPRATDFRTASAGLQLQVSEAGTTIDTAVADLKGFTTLLRNAIDEIKHLQKLATARQATADQFTRDHPTDSANIDRENQHCATYIGQLEGQAADLRDGVRRAALATAGLLDAGTDLAVPHSATLSPADIARKVDATTGVSGIQAALSAGSLTADQAWGALATARTELPSDVINSDGSVDWKKLAEELNRVKEEEAENPSKKALDTSLDLWTLSTAGPGGWSLAQLAGAATEFAQAKSALPVDLFKLTQHELDAIPKGPAENPLSVLDSIERGLQFTGEDARAFAADAKLSSALEGVGGLGRLEVLGRIFDGAAVVGDVWTLADPKSANDDRVDAGLNLAGLAMTTDVGAGVVASGLEAGGLVAADAAVGWVPVVGWVLVAGTAGYEVYKHWDTVKQAGKEVANFVTSTAPHALSSAAHSVGNFVSSHVPHVHLW